MSSWFRLWPRPTLNLVSERSKKRTDDNGMRRKEKYNNTGKRSKENNCKKREKNSSRLRDVEVAKKQRQKKRKTAQSFQSKHLTDAKRYLHLYLPMYDNMFSAFTDKIYPSSEVNNLTFTPRCSYSAVAFSAVDRGAQRGLTDAVETQACT